MPASDDSKPPKKRGSQLRVKSKVSDSEVEDSEPERGAEPEVQAGIEAILDASTGFLPNNKLGYLVKWKGFGPEDNKWVGEDNPALEAASDMVKAFWGDKNGSKTVTKVGSKRALNSQKSQSHASTDEATVAPDRKRGRPPLSKKSDKQPPEKDHASSTDDAAVAPKKRGRPPLSKKSDEQPPKKIHASPNADEAAVTPKKRGRPPLSKKSDEEPPAKKENWPEDKEFGNMGKYTHAPAWDQFIKRIDTVECLDETLYVYFTLHGGERIREESKLCAEKCPKMLINFYECNLRYV
ncbi:hypothetical protein C8R47DRAFT_1214222 [Mycena vitilis]|nr:hypothetical protein C8R47DRAFT_1214222 [Mycena vitilis]